MKPPYDITPDILKLISSISEQIGAFNARFLNKASPQLRKQNRIRTIQASLQIEGNTLTEEQITALMEHKRVIGPKKEVLEVQNAISVYENVSSFKSYTEKHFLKAHSDLMNGLMEHPGRYRTQGVGIVKGSNVAHVAPPAENVPFLMKELFHYLKDPNEITLIKSCVFHYEMEFIHPFMDGNGRMGRLWQTLILSEEYPVFSFLPFETLISRTQEDYYRSLAASDKAGTSTAFIQYMLGVINLSLLDLLNQNSPVLKDTDRLAYFISLGISEFSRKDYLNVFKGLSTATASRDLKKGIELNLIKSSGARNRTRYSVI